MGIMMIAGTERRRQGCSLQDGKQWGINTGGAVRTSTLPIPFTNVFLAVASTSSEWCCPGCSATNTTVTTRAYQSNRPDVAQPTDVNWIIIGCQPQWGYYTAAVGAIYTDVTTPVSFSRCFFAASIDILLAASTTWPGTTQTVWNINASTANKLRFIWAKAPIELDGAVWFGIFIQTVGTFNWRLRRLGFKIQWCLYGSSCWRPWLSGKRVLWFYFRLHPYRMEFCSWI